MRPAILISAHTEAASGEFPDAALSLSSRYSDALIAAGGLPLVLPPTADPAIVRAAVARADGVLLTGGDDVDPALYNSDLPPGVHATVEPACGGRDLFDLVLIEEAFRQERPLFAICRGQQIVNVALGGTLVADLPLQRPGALSHNLQDRRFEPVHDVLPEPGSLLARIAGSDAPFGVNSTHHQAVDRVAPALRVAGRSPDGMVEALELAPDSGARIPFFLAVQFHPERLFDRHPIHARLFAAFIEAARQSTHRP